MRPALFHRLNAERVSGTLFLSGVLGSLMRGFQIDSQGLLEASLEFHDPELEMTSVEDPYWKYVVQWPRDFFLDLGRSDQFLELVYDWTACRGVSRERQIDLLASWVPAHLRELLSLRDRHVEELSDTEIERVGSLYLSLISTEKVGSTCAAKTLHFFLPDTVCLWDRKIVRQGTYGLGESESEFCRYQRMARAVAQAIINEEGPSAVLDIRRDHVTQLRERGWIAGGGAGLTESFPKIFDELAYEGVWCRAALKSLGLWHTP